MAKVVTPPDKTKWYDIPGYEGVYQINVDAQAISIAPFKQYRNSTRIGNKNKLLKMSTHAGYKAYHLCIGGKPATVYVHRVLALIFIPNPENKPQVNHINGIKSDNRIDNLEWVTSQENIRHVYKNKLKKNHYGLGISTLTTPDAEEIKRLYKNGQSQSSIAKMFNSIQSQISRIINDKILPL